MKRPSLRSLFQFCKRPRVLLAAGVLVLAGVLGGPHLWAWYQLAAGRSALEHYRAAEAREHLARCLAVWPSSVEANLLAARAARRLGELDEAGRRLDDCRRLAGEQASGDIALEWALLQAARGDLPLVEEHLLARLARDPEAAPLILEALAAGYQRMVRVHEALRCLNDWLRLQPDNPQALSQRGATHRQVGATKKAVDDYQALLRVDPGNDAGRRMLAKCLVDVGRYEEALGHLEILLRREPADPELLTLAGRARYDLGQKEEARKALQAVAEAHPDYGPALKELGRIEAAAGDDAAAERWLRKAVGRLPYDYQTVFALGQSLERQGRLQEAKQFSERAQRLKDRLERVAEIQRRDMSERPFDPALRVELGRLLASLGQKEGGSRWLLTAVQLDPGNVAAHAALADYYEETGDTARAATHRRLAAEARAAAAPGKSR